MDKSNIQISITDDFINELISCKKKIIMPPSPKDKANGLHKQTNMELESVDKKYKFSVFIRENTKLMEFFSVGLVYHRDKETDIIIIRYNGNHGAHRNYLNNELIEEGFHIHKYSAEAVELSIRAENHAQITDKYSTLQEALLSFFTDMNINNFKKYYQDLSQTALPFK